MDHCWLSQTLANSCPRKRKRKRKIVLNKTSFLSQLYSIRNPNSKVPKTTILRQWNTSKLAIGRQCTAFDHPVNELKQRFRLVFSIQPLMHLGFQKVWVAVYQFPQRIVFPRHDKVRFTKTKGRAVVTLAVPEVDEVFLPVVRDGRFDFL